MLIVFPDVAENLLRIYITISRLCSKLYNHWNWNGVAEYSKISKTFGTLKSTYQCWVVLVDCCLIYHEAVRNPSSSACYFYTPAAGNLRVNTSLNSTARLDSLWAPAHFLIRKCKRLAAVDLNEFTVVGTLPYLLCTYLVKFRKKRDKNVRQFTWRPAYIYDYFGY